MHPRATVGGAIVSRLLQSSCRLGRSVSTLILSGITHDRSIIRERLPHSNGGFGVLPLRRGVRNQFSGGPPRPDDPIVALGRRRRSVPDRLAPEHVPTAGWHPGPRVPRHRGRLDASASDGGRLRPTDRDERRVGPRPYRSPRSTAWNDGEPSLAFGAPRTSAPGRRDGVGRLTGATSGVEQRCRSLR